MLFQPFSIMINEFTNFRIFQDHYNGLRQCRMISLVD